MARIAQSITDLIGNTPLLRLNNIEKEYNTHAHIIAKIESFNPAGSAKDRVALSMITDAEQNGKLTKGGTIIEPTSGNTGIGLALIAPVRGYRLILTMPDTMSIERRNLLSAMGAEIVLTPGDKGMNGAIEEAERLNKNISGSIILQQFKNPANPKVHELTTGPEIWHDTDGNVDFFVAGIGTGGTISGIGRFLKKQNPNIKIIGIEPATSAVLSGKNAGPHKIQGIGAGFIPEIYDNDIVDYIFAINDNDAMDMARKLLSTESLFVGISSGAAMFGAIKLAQMIENKGKNIIVLLPDTGERYLSTDLFQK